ncbi:hypothetical protein A2U01_0061733, partial [Trifolium medium]|nr:hypothetical protein [Trifolium medium]
WVSMGQGLEALLFPPVVDPCPSLLEENSSNSRGGTFEGI